MRPPRMRGAEQVGVGGGVGAGAQRAARAPPPPAPQPAVGGHPSGIETWGLSIIIIEAHHVRTADGSPSKEGVLGLVY